MRTVICNKCNIGKQESEFIKDNRIKSGIRPVCIECGKEYQLQYREINREKRKVANKRWQKNNPDYALNFREKYPEKIKLRYKKGNENRIDYIREYTKKNKERIDKKSRLHYQLNKERKAALRIEHRKLNMPKIRKTMKAYLRKRCLVDPVFKISLTLRCRTKGAFRVKRWYKNSKTEKLLGAPYEIVKKYIENKFTKGMNWDNYGKGNYKWNIDHVIPLASAKTEEELIKLCHFTNLQPLWSLDNMKKSAKMPISHQLTLPI